MYTFKPWQELLYGVLTAIAFVVLTELVALDPSAITDWQQWTIAIGVGAVRAAAAVALNWIRATVVGNTEE